MTIITKRELTQDNIEAHGTAYTAKHLRKSGVPFSIAYWLMFGSAPRQLGEAPNPVARRIRLLLTIREQVRLCN